MAGVPVNATVPIGLEALVARLAAAEQRIERLEAELARRLPRNFRVEYADGAFRFANDATGATAPSGV